MLHFNGSKISKSPNFSINPWKIYFFNMHLWLPGNSPMAPGGQKFDFSSFFGGGGSIFHYWIWTRVDRKVTLWSLNLIHKFNLNYLLIKPTKTICFHAMRPSKYQNNNTESLMGVQTSYMLLDWTILFLNFQENWQTLVFTMFQVWKGNVHNTQQN